MRNSDFITRILNLQQGEGKLVLLPFLYSFFSGASMAFFVTSTTSLFLTNFSRDMLSVVFIASGVFVWIIGQVYSKIQKKQSYSTTIKLGLIFLLISIGILLSFYIATASVIIIFILYAWIRVFAYLHAVTFWGMLGRLFALQQAKRLFGLITGGEVLASIVSFFSIPLLVNFLTNNDLLIISGISLLVSFFLIMLILKQNSQKLLAIKSNVKQNNETPVKKISFLDNKYYRLFFVIAFVPIFAQFFVDFIFQAQLKIEFPDKEALTAFVGVFFGVSSIVEFVLKAFVSGRMMSKYGMKLGLLAFPAVLAFSFFLASVVGIFYGTITLFFSFVTLGRLFTRAVRTAFNDPASQILYQPLPIDERTLFQNKVESGPKAYASIFAGILLLIFVNIPGINLVHFALFLLVVIVLWLKSALDIHTEYKNILQSVLKKTDAVKFKSRADIIFTILEDYILKAQNESQLSIIKLARIILPFRTYRLIEEKNINHFAISLQNYKFKELTNYSKSENPTERRVAAAELANYQVYRVERLLKRLLNDDNFRVRTEAIITAGKIKDKELFQFLINNFTIPEYSDTAASAMVNVGNQLIPYMNMLFARLEYDVELQVKIISVFEEIGDDDAIKFLKNNVNHPNRLVSDSVVLALDKLNYQATKQERLFFSNKLEDEIDNFVYLVACLHDLEEIDENQFIIKALNLELEMKHGKIFSLLSIIYEAAAIDLIRKNIESNDIDSRGFALEIADMAIDEMHKELLLPIFNQLSNSELLKSYKFIFAYPKLNHEQRLINIVNSPFSKTSDYTKAAALHYLSTFSSEDVVIVCKANLVNPNLMIRQIAAQNLLNIDEQMFDNLLAINKPKYPMLFDLPKKSEFISNEKSLIFHKLNFFKQLEMFKSISYFKLEKLAFAASLVKLQAKQKISIHASNANVFYIHLSGLLLDNEQNNYVEAGSILCIYNTKDNLRELIFEAQSSCTLYTAEIYLLNNLLLEDKEFIQKYAQDVWWN